MVWFRNKQQDKKILDLETKIDSLQNKINQLEVSLTDIRLEKYQSNTPNPSARWMPSPSSIMQRRDNLIPTDNDNRFLYDKLVIEFKTFQFPQNITDLLVFYTKANVDNRVFKILYNEIKKQFQEMGVKIPFIMLGNELEIAEFKGSDTID